MRRHSLRSLMRVDQPVTVSTHRFQILWPMCTSVRSKLPVMDLQQIGATTASAPPSVLLQDPPAVDLVNAVYEQGERDALLAVLRFHDQILPRERAVTEGAAAIRNPAHLVAGQHLRSPLGHNPLLFSGNCFEIVL